MRDSLTGFDGGQTSGRRCPQERATRNAGEHGPESISRKVAELEAHLKVQLLVRSTRKVTLTEAGANYVAACKRILEHVGEAEAQASGEYAVPRGELTLTAPIVFGRLRVVPLVSEFLSQFAEINIRMTLSLSAKVDANSLSEPVCLERSTSSLQFS